MSKFISPLAPLMQAFISYRKASGRWNEASYEVNLSLFDKYCDKHFPDASELSQGMTDSWCANVKLKQTIHVDPEYILWSASYVICANVE